MLLLGLVLLVLLVVVCTRAPTLLVLVAYAWASLLAPLLCAVCGRQSAAWLQ